MLRKLTESLLNLHTVVCRGPGFLALVDLFDDVPKLKDEEACRLWCKDLAALLKHMNGDLVFCGSKLFTQMQMRDGQGELKSDALVKIVADNRAWEALYELIVRLVDEPRRYGAELEDVCVVSRVGVNPVMILPIVNLIIVLLNSWAGAERERHQRSEEEAAEAQLLEAKLAGLVPG